MANIGLFLPPDDKLLKARIDSNFDQDMLTAIIYDQQQLEIKPIIGSGLYDELESQIIAGTVTALNQTLRNYIQDALRHYVLSDWQFEATVKNTNKGSQTMSGENSSPSDIPFLSQKTQRYRDKGQIYSDRLTRYLIENSSSYPLYYNPGTGVDTIHPKHNSSAYTNWVMDDDDDYCTLDNP